MCFFIVANNLAIATDYLFVLQLCVTDVLMYVVELCSNIFTLGGILWKHWWHIEKESDSEIESVIDEDIMSITEDCLYMYNEI